MKNFFILIFTALTILSYGQESAIFYFQVKAYAKNLVAINGGTLNGIYPGGRINFHTANTTDTTSVKPLVTGVVDYSDLFTSDVILNTPYGKSIENA